MKRFSKYIIIYVLLAFFSCYDGENVSSSSFHYRTPVEINAFLADINTRYPSITSIEQVGKSQSGVYDIKALVISNTPGTPGIKPAVRLTGGIHGNEKMGIELLVRFIEYLTANYSTDSAVKNLVDTRYICIIPAFNPDGLAADTRYNIRGVDLNRNFNDAGNHWKPGSDHGLNAFSESETLAMQSYSSAKNFSLSITYHIGNVLVNLPFDYGKESGGVIPAQYPLVKTYAKTYTKSGTFLSNPDLYIDLYMDEGTINGGDWYVITGSLQDWSYTQTHCLDLTIEVANYNPSSEQGVQQVFMYNRDSIMAYISKAGDDTFNGL